MGSLQSAASRGLALVDSWWGLAVVFLTALAVWWVQAIAMPLGRGRDFGTYIGAYVELFQRDPIDLGYVLGRTPIAPLVTGGLLHLAGGALAEPGVSVLYALSICAWFVAARSFGPVCAVAATVVLLVYPGYGIVFHELASDSVFAAAFAGWSLLAVRAVLVPTPARFALVGAGIAGLVLVRPGNQALLVLTLLPLAMAIPWRTRLASAGALAGSAVALLGLWVVHNGVLYGTYTVATGGNSRLPFERAFLADRIVRPENGAKSRELGVLVASSLLTEEPYRSYGVGLDDFFSDPSPRMIVDLSALSNRRYGWKDDSRILRSVGIEAVRAHPGTYARGVSTTIWDLLHQPVYRSLSPPPEVPSGPNPGSVSSAGETIVVDGKVLPKPTEGERIPGPHEAAPTTADGGIHTVWTSATERHLVFDRPEDEERLDALHERMGELAGRMPHRSGNAALARRLNQASRWFPPPILWLLLGVAGLAIRRPARSLALATPAIAALIVIVLNALAIPSVPHYAVPVAPAYVLLAAGAVLGARRERRVPEPLA